MNKLIAGDWDSRLRQAAWILFGKQKFYHRIYKLSSFLILKEKKVIRAYGLTGFINRVGNLPSEEAVFALF